MAHRPRYGIAATLGVYSSASTWVYNVLRELHIAAYGADQVHAAFSDTVKAVLEDPLARDRHIVWKLHQADDSWALFASLTQARVVLTMRDPRDAIASMMQRFGSAFEPLVDPVFLVMRRVAEGLQAGYPGLRYEDRFFEKIETVTALCNYLELPVAPREQQRIFAAYTTDNVRRLGLAVEHLPPDRVESMPGTAWDRVTHIHRRHIGDQKIGKWREHFTTEQCALLNRRFAPYLKAFGYDPR